MTKKVLDGVVVLDLTNVLSGPFATLHLALLGAEIGRASCRERVSVVV